MLTVVSHFVARFARRSMCLFLVILSGAAAADDADFDYDLFLHNDTLMLWIDVTPALTQPRMEDLLAGLDISIRIDIEVKRPRRLLFSKTIASTESVVVVSRRLARDTYRLHAVGAAAVERIFKNQLILSDFLADSLEIPVIPADVLAGQEVRLDIGLISKSHSNNTLGDYARLPEDTAGTGRRSDREFFESMFSAFLDLVGFGTSSYRFSTPSFFVDDLPAF